MNWSGRSRDTIQPIRSVSHVTLGKSLVPLVPGTSGSSGSVHSHMLLGLANVGQETKTSTVWGLSPAAKVILPLPHKAEIPEDESSPGEVLSQSKMHMSWCLHTHLLLIARPFPSHSPISLLRFLHLPNKLLIPNISLGQASEKTSWD